MALSSPALSDAALITRLFWLDSSRSVRAAAFSLTSEVLMPEGALKRETEDPVGEQMLRTAGIGVDVGIAIDRLD